jgi:hypothetical protein
MPITHDGIGVLPVEGAFKIGSDLPGNGFGIKSEQSIFRDQCKSIIIKLNFIRSLSSEAGVLHPAIRLPAHS